MQAGRSTLLWVRLAGVAVTVAGLWLVFRRLRFDTLAETLAAMRPGWFVAAVALYGALFVPACIRWRLLLRLIEVDIPSRPLGRIYLIGHFFYVVLLGAVGGDTARSALCARWYRLSLAAILATAPLDRLLGFIGLLAFSGLAGGIAWATGGLSRLDGVAFKMPSWWVFPLLALGVLVALLLWRAVAGNFLRNFINALASGARLVWASPRVALTGAGCGFLVQVALALVMACNLQALCQSPLPWSHMAWVFPFLSVAGGLPITVGGLGAREAAALYLLSLYGVSSAVAVGASLLTFAASVFWAVVGALLLLWEFYQRRSPRPALCPNRSCPGPEP